MGKSAPLCCLCRYPMQTDGYLWTGKKKPKMFVPVMHCVNNKCPRYGLLAILKAIGSGE